MPQAPYKFTDRRSSSGYVASNSLVRAATRNTDRQTIPPLDRDFHRNVSSIGRRTLMSIARYLFWNFPAIQGAVLEQANLAVSSFIPQYYGRDKKGFGNDAENWLFEWHKIFDIEGPPYDYDTFVQHLIIADLVDGDIGVILTETPEGYPMIQVIPAHLIGSRYYPERVVEGGPYDGATIIDGIIVDDYTRPLAARIHSDEFLSDKFTDVSMRNMILSFWPIVRGQKRGLPSLVSAMFDWQDVHESRQFELVAQKVAAAIYLIENNETGDIDEAKAVMSSLVTYDAETGAKTANAKERLTGEIRRFRANTGSKLDPFIADRPTANQAAFEDRIVRSAFCGLEWSFDFCLDPSHVGGAPMRVIVEKINRVIEKRQKMVAKVCRRVDGYGLSKAVKRKELREDPDWWMWEYQAPARMTADAKYESDIDIQEMRNGIKTRKEACGRRGQYWEDVDAQRMIEVRSDLQRAKELAQEFGITIQEALILLSAPTPNGNLPQPAQEEEDPESE